MNYHSSGQLPLGVCRNVSPELYASIEELPIFGSEYVDESFQDASDLLGSETIEGAIESIDIEDYRFPRVEELYYQACNFAYEKNCFVGYRLSCDVAEAKISAFKEWLLAKRNRLLELDDDLLLLGHFGMYNLSYLTYNGRPMFESIFNRLLRLSVEACDVNYPPSRGDRYVTHTIENIRDFYRDEWPCKLRVREMYFNRFTKEKFSEGVYPSPYEGKGFVDFVYTMVLKGSQVCAVRLDSHDFERRRGFIRKFLFAFSVFRNGMDKGKEEGVNAPRLTEEERGHYKMYVIMKQIINCAAAMQFSDPYTNANVLATLRCMTVGLCYGNACFKSFLYYVVGLRLFFLTGVKYINGVGHQRMCELFSKELINRKLYMGRFYSLLDSGFDERLVWNNFFDENPETYLTVNRITRERHEKLKPHILKERRDWANLALPVSLELSNFEANYCTVLFGLERTRALKKRQHESGECGFGIVVRSNVFQHESGQRSGEH